MPLQVTSFCSYLVTDNYGLWRPEDHNATKFVKALKGETLKGYAYIPVLGMPRFLDNKNLEDSVSWFADMVAHHMQQNGVESPFVLVPIPNSETTTKSAAKPRTLKLAKAIAKKVGAECEVSDCLRWKINLGSARKGSGGTREASVLFANLVLTEEIQEDIQYILIDDAKASGGHLQACAAKLKKNGVEDVRAFCGCYTVHDPPDSAFATIDEELDDYEP